MTITYEQALAAAEGPLFNIHPYFNGGPLPVWTLLDEELADDENFTRYINSHS